VHKCILGNVYVQALSGKETYCRSKRDLLLVILRNVYVQALSGKETYCRSKRDLLLVILRNVYVRVHLTQILT
jgi:hypothetical protein